MLTNYNSFRRGGGEGAEPVSKEKFLQNQLSSQFIGLAFIIAGLVLGLKAQEVFNQDGDNNCSSGRLEDAIDLYVIVQSILLGFAGITFLRIVTLMAGIGDLEENPKAIFSGTALYFYGLLGFGLAIFKFVWFILYASAYSDEIEECLADGNEEFDDAYDFLKPILIIEAIPYGCGAFALCLVCFCLIPFTLYAASRE